MNEALMEIAREAGAPEEMMTELWFNIFCIKFADAILTLAEESLE